MKLDFCVSHNYIQGNLLLLFCPTFLSPPLYLAWLLELAIRVLYLAWLPELALVIYPFPAILF
jgi:hypothetical protein